MNHDQGARTMTILDDVATTYGPDWWPKQGPTEYVRDDSDDGAAIVRALDAAMEALHWALHSDKPAAATGIGGLSRDAKDTLSLAFRLPEPDPNEAV